MLASVNRLEQLTETCCHTNDLMTLAGQPHEVLTLLNKLLCNWLTEACNFKFGVALERFAYFY